MNKPRLHFVCREEIQKIHYELTESRREYSVNKRELEKHRKENQEMKQKVQVLQQFRYSRMCIIWLLMFKNKILDFVDTSPLYQVDVSQLFCTKITLLLTIQCHTLSKKANYIYIFFNI